MKKVDEGVELFDEIWEKVYSAEQPNQKEKFEEFYLNTHRLKDSDREEALNDLTMMGISPATIFPGLEGACQAMKARHFGY